eukprot:COSAG01_NODE_3007_length_6730_cov_10.756899_8_plen_126_part_00
MTGSVNGVPYTDAQKAEMARCIVEKQQEFAIHNNVSAFVQAYPNFLLDQRFPPINSKKYTKGDQPESWQQTLILVSITSNQQPPTIINTNKKWKSTVFEHSIQQRFWGLGSKHNGFGGGCPCATV